MEETNNLAGLRITAGNIRSLEAVAMNTGEGEILQFGFPSVLSCDDVIYLEGSWMEN